MVFIAREAKRELWNERVRAFRASGQSRKAWCEEHDVPEHQLNYWLRKPLDKSQPTPSRWVTMEAVAPSGSGISVRIGTVVLEVERDFDREVLADVVLTLTAIC